MAQKKKKKEKNDDFLKQILVIWYRQSAILYVFCVNLFYFESVQSNVNQSKNSNIFAF